MTGSEHPVTMVDIEGIDRAARALAVNDGKTWGNAEVRNYYRGLAVAAVAEYLGTSAAVVGVTPA